jgi:hypothetical protein
VSVGRADAEDQGYGSALFAGWRVGYVRVRVLGQGCKCIVQGGDEA